MCRRGGWRGGANMFRKLLQYFGSYGTSDDGCCVSLEYLADIYRLAGSLPREVILRSRDCHIFRKTLFAFATPLQHSRA